VIRDFPLAAAPTLADRANRWLSQPSPGPVPRLAATVMFVRDGSAGPEVFMLRRVATMAFAPSMWVFPGGGVDPRDAAPELPWAGPDVSQWAARLETTEEAARELVAAAVREVFEECGVLLAGPGPGSVLGDVGSPDWHQRRRQLLTREASLVQVLVERGLAIRSDLLSYRAHWVTPEFESRRYDTRFFAAAVPVGQRADDQTSEADTTAWVHPAELIEQMHRGEALMLPPTLVCLEQLAEAASAADFLAEQPSTARVLPVLAATDNGAVLRADLP
jgi:8-oxo-dGTP pyrophosphatase MutT (NUDIX family)